MTPFVKPSEIEFDLKERVLDENGVERTKDGRPYIKPDPALFVPGPRAKTFAQVMSQFETYMRNKKRSYTRMTTFIDALEDKSGLCKWQQRMLLIGVRNKPELLDDVPYLHPDDDKAGKDALNSAAEQARDIAGSNRKSAQGTLLHALSEYVDRGESLPEGTSDADRLDMLGYWEATQGLTFTHIERMVVLDYFKIAGTPDRLARVPGVEGTVIADLKTGSMDYPLKMAAQLAGYSRGRFYDIESGVRRDLPEDVRTDWGLIISLPAGTGEAELVWINLDMGWELLLEAKEVREKRGWGRKVLSPFDKGPYGV